MYASRMRFILEMLLTGSPGQRPPRRGIPRPIRKASDGRQGADATGAWGLAACEACSELLGCECYERSPQEDNYQVFGTRY